MRFVQAGTMLLGTAMYLLIAAFLGELATGDNLHWFFFIVGYWNTLLIVVTTFVVIDSIRKMRAGMTRQLAAGALAVKLAGIPFFLLNFALLSGFGLMGMVILIRGGMALLFVVWVGSGLTYLVMLSTSVYTWAAIARLRRERGIGTGLAVLYFLLSIVFVTDVVASILVFGHSRKRAGRALVSVLLTVGAILIALAFLPTGSEPSDPFTLDLHGFGIAGAALVGVTVVGIVIWFLTARRRKASTEVEMVAEAGHDPATSRL